MLLLAAHAWRGAPFEALGHLIDIVVTRQGVSADDLATQAHAWGVDQLWRNTAAAIDQILTGGGGRALASLTRNFDPLRERSVVEAKLAELAAPFYGLPTRAAARATVRQLAHELQRDLGESRRHKLVRTATAIHQIFRPRSERDKFLRREAVDSKRGPTRRRHSRMRAGAHSTAAVACRHLDPDYHLEKHVGAGQEIGEPWIPRAYG